MLELWPGCITHVHLKAIKKKLHFWVCAYIHRRRTLIQVLPPLNAYTKSYCCMLMPIGIFSEMDLNAYTTIHWWCLLTLKPHPKKLMLLVSCMSWGPFGPQSCHGLPKHEYVTYTLHQKKVTFSSLIFPSDLRLGDTQYILWMTNPNWGFSAL